MGTFEMWSKAFKEQLSTFAIALLTKEQKIGKIMKRKILFVLFGQNFCETFEIILFL